MPRTGTQFTCAILTLQTNNLLALAALI